MSVDSFKHKEEKRVLIPSKEEAGSEQVNPIVKNKGRADYPLNPVTTRGQDPELFWMHKYGSDDQEEHLTVDIRSLYRYEHVLPETLIKGLYRTVKTEEAESQPDIWEVFGNSRDIEEMDKPLEYYTHPEDWSNRLIQGDSLLVMASLLEREGYAGKVQMIYIDPPYGIKYGSNWQIRLNDRKVKDGDEHLSSEPEQIKAFRDTWELGIHTYLSYLRDRLLVSKDLLAESGSCFVQISDENVHLVRCLMDEVFGSENFCSQITFQKTGSIAGSLLGTTVDYIIWYSKDKSRATEKYHQMYKDRKQGDPSLDRYDQIALSDGRERRLSAAEIRGEIPLPDGERFQTTSLFSDGESDGGSYTYRLNGRDYPCAKGSHWKTTKIGLDRLAKKGRILAKGTRLRYKRYLNDLAVIPIDDRWGSMQIGRNLDLNPCC